MDGVVEALMKGWSFEMVVVDWKNEGKSRKEERRQIHRPGWEYEARLTSTWYVLPRALLFPLISSGSQNGETVTLGVPIATIFPMGSYANMETDTDEYALCFPSNVPVYWCRHKQLQTAWTCFLNSHFQNGIPTISDHVAFLGHQ